MVMRVTRIGFARSCDRTERGPGFAPGRSCRATPRVYRVVVALARRVTPRRFLRAVLRGIWDPCEALLDLGQRPACLGGLHSHVPENTGCA